MKDENPLDVMPSGPPAFLDDVDGDMAEQEALVAARSNLCPDCSVEPGKPHEEGCDVARCRTCGMQALMCDMTGGHVDGTEIWGTVWTGEWPGEEELREGLADDLNDLAIKGVRGHLRWDGQRWQRPGYQWVCATCGTAGTKPTAEEASAEATKHENAGCVAHELEPIPEDHVWRRMYEGEWIAVFDHVVVAHGKTSVEVYRQVASTGTRGVVVQHMARRKPQSQASLYDQMRELRGMADRAGLYDASDWLAQHLALIEVDPAE